MVCWVEDCESGQDFAIGESVFQMGHQTGEELCFDVFLEAGLVSFGNFNTVGMQIGA